MKCVWAEFEFKFSPELARTRNVKYLVPTIVHSHVDVIFAHF